MEIKILAAGALCTLIFIFGVWLQILNLKKLSDAFIEKEEGAFIGVLFWFIVVASFVWANITTDKAEIEQLEGFAKVGYVVLSLAAILGGMVVFVFLLKPSDSFGYVGNTAWSVTVSYPFFIALVIFFLVSFSVIGAYIMSSLDVRQVADKNHALEIIKGIAIFLTAFLIKNILGSLLLISTLTWFVWNYLVYNEYDLIPIFQIVIEKITIALPDWVGILYIAVVLIYSAISTLISLIDGNLVDLTG